MGASRLRPHIVSSMGVSVPPTSASPRTRAMRAGKARANRGSSIAPTEWPASTQPRG